MEIKKIGDLKKAITNSEKLVLVEFWSSWCPPCQRMKEIIDELEEQQQGRLDVLRVNPDMNSAFSFEYQIKAVPTFIFFKQGKEIKREMGAKSKRELLSIVLKILDE